MAVAFAPRPAPAKTRRLTSEQCHHVRFVLELVDLLAERYGFNPATLINPRTGAPLGPAIARMRDELAVSDPPAPVGDRAAARQQPPRDAPSRRPVTRIV